MRSLLSRVTSYQPWRMLAKTIRQWERCLWPLHPRWETSTLSTVENMTQLQHFLRRWDLWFHGYPSHCCNSARLRQKLRGNRKCWGVVEIAMATSGYGLSKNWMVVRKFRGAVEVAERRDCNSAGKYIELFVEITFQTSVKKLATWNFCG